MKNTRQMDKILVKIADVAKYLGSKLDTSPALGILMDDSRVLERGGFKLTYHEVRALDDRGVAWTAKVEYGGATVFDAASYYGTTYAPGKWENNLELLHEHAIRVKEAQNEFKVAKGRLVIAQVQAGC